MEKLSIGMFIALLALTGCTRWVQPGVSERQFAVDKYECSRESAYIPDPAPPPAYITPVSPYQSAWGAGIQGALQGQAYGKTLQRPSSKDIFRMCMEARGYSRE